MSAFEYVKLKSVVHCRSPGNVAAGLLLPEHKSSYFNRKISCFGKSSCNPGKNVVCPASEHAGAVLRIDLGALLKTVTFRYIGGAVTCCWRLAFAVAALASGHASAGDDAIATDRPDFVESSNVVGKGRLQVETSMALDRSAQDGVRVRVVSTPTLLRYGVSDTVELRLETDGAVRQRVRGAGTGNQTDSGFADTSLGVKWHALDAIGSAPSVGVLLHADLASGSSSLRGSGVRPSARVVAEWEFDGGYSAGVMPGIGYERDGNGTTFGIFGLVLGKAWTDRTRSFVEISSPRIARTSDGGTEAIISTGLAYLVSDNVQIDTAVSRGLNSRSPDLSLTIGLSFKL